MYSVFFGRPWWLSLGKGSACNVGDLGSIPGLERSPGGGHDNLLQCSCFRKSHGLRSLAGYIVHGVAKSQTQLSNEAQHIQSFVDVVYSETICFRCIISLLKLNRVLARNSLFRVTWFVNGWLELEVRQSVLEAKGCITVLSHLVLIPQHGRFFLISEISILLFSCLVVSDSLVTPWTGSSVHGISQARILEWVAISFSRGSRLNLHLLYWHVDSLPLSNLPQFDTN